MLFRPKLRVTLISPSPSIPIFDPWQAFFFNSIFKIYLPSICYSFLPHLLYNLAWVAIITLIIIAVQHPASIPVPALYIVIHAILNTGYYTSQKMSLACCKSSSIFREVKYNLCMCVGGREERWEGEREIQKEEERKGGGKEGEGERHCAGTHVFLWCVYTMCMYTMEVREQSQVLFLGYCPPFKFISSYFIFETAFWTGLELTDWASTVTQGVTRIHSFSSPQG